MWSVVIRIVIQRPGNVAKRAPIACHGLVRTLACVIQRLTWSKRVAGPGQDNRVRHPSFGRPELPATDSIQFARDWWDGRQRLDPNARCSIYSPELASSLVLRLLAQWTFRCFRPNVGRDASAPIRHHFRFFLGDERVILSSLRKAGDSCSFEIALINAISSCLSMVLSWKMFLLVCLMYFNFQYNPVISSKPRAGSYVPIIDGKKDLSNRKSNTELGKVIQIFSIQAAFPLVSW